jgi:hypothetical protein
VRSAEILLKKAVPDLASIAHKGDGGGPIKVVIASEDAGLL